MISKHEKDINDIKISLDSLKKGHVSLISEQFNVFDIIAEKVVKIDFDTYSILKLENEKT